MFFWIVTVFYTLQYLIRGVVTILFTPLMAEVYFGVDADKAGMLLYASAALELIFAMTCIVVMVLRQKKSPKAIRLWLIVLGAVAAYEIAWVVLTLRTGTDFADLVWPVITIYIFLRGLASAKKYRISDTVTTTSE